MLHGGCSRHSGRRLINPRSFRVLVFVSNCIGQKVLIFRDEALGAMLLETSTSECFLRWCRESQTSFLPASLTYHQSKHASATTPYAPVTGICAERVNSTPQPCNIQVSAGAQGRQDVVWRTQHDRMSLFNEFKSHISRSL